MVKRDYSFWWFFAVMAGITIIIIFINIKSPVSANELTDTTIKHIKTPEDRLNNIQGTFDHYGRIINSFITIDDSLLFIEEEIEAVENEYLASNDLVECVFYQIETNNGVKNKYIDRTGVIDNPLSGILKDIYEADYLVYTDGLWKRGIYEKNREECFIYIKPIAAMDKNYGYIGFIIPSKGLYEMIESNFEALGTDFLFFINENEAAIKLNELGLTSEKEYYAFDETGAGYIKNMIDYNEIIYTYKVLYNKMVFIEIHKDSKRIKYSNEMIVLISLFSIIAMWLVQGRFKDGRSVFDITSDYIMKNYIHKLNSIQRQGHRAAIALNIGLTTAIFADLVYSAVVGRDIKAMSSYFIFLIMSTGSLMLYKFSKNGITKKVATTIIIFGLIGSLADHLLAGGFALGKAGESFLWFIACQYTALFLLNIKNTANILNIIVVLLYFDIIFETALFHKTNYMVGYMFIAGFILLGFALYNAMVVYVSGAAGHYKQTKKLISEIEKNQDLLLQKEKLGALGQLVSGVAHEINTPIGAIKASAETMNSMFSTMIKEILNAADDLDDKEYEIFLELTHMTLINKSKMKSTSEIRKAKNNIKTYFNDIKLKDSRQILDYLAELEIVDMDEIIDIIDILKMENIVMVLKKVSKLTSFSSGIPIILYSSDKVAQIVVALKSYVHTSINDISIKFDMIKTIENILILYHNQIKSGINVNWIYNGKECIIMGNPDELTQAWANIIQNTINSMNGTGELTISIDEMDEDTVYMSIRDTGDGIDPKILDDTYKGIYAASIEGDGIRLNLSIVKRIIEKQGGSFRIEHQEGRGTIYHMNLSRN